MLIDLQIFSEEFSDVEQMTTQRRRRNMTMLVMELMKRVSLQMERELKWKSLAARMAVWWSPESQARRSAQNVVAERCRSS